MNAELKSRADQIAKLVNLIDRFDKALEINKSPVTVARIKGPLDEAKIEEALRICYLDLKRQVMTEIELLLDQAPNGAQKESILPPYREFPRMFVSGGKE